MKIKTKKIIIYTFCLGLILCTVILSVAAAVSSYSYDINNSVDVFGGFGAAFYLMLGSFFVLYETDLFCTVHYFIFKPKTKLKTALNILSNLSLLRQYNQGTILPIAENLSVYIVYSIFCICSLIFSISALISTTVCAISISCAFEPMVFASLFIS